MDTRGTGVENGAFRQGVSRVFHVKGHRCLRGRGDTCIYERGDESHPKESPPINL